jgi:phage baseplate assembly protein V
LYRRGVVEELSPGRHQARVRFAESNDLLSPWLDVIVRAVHADKEHGLPAVGDQVACMLDERGEQGCVLGAIYSEADAPPEGSDTRRGWHFADGGRVEYDGETHTLTVIVPEGMVHVQGHVQIGGGAEPLALADRTKDRLDALEEWANQHTHGTGVGPSSPPTQPAPTADPVGSDVARSD